MVEALTSQGYGLGGWWAVPIAGRGHISTRIRSTVGCVTTYVVGIRMAALAMDGRHVGWFAVSGSEFGVGVRD